MSAKDALAKFCERHAKDLERDSRPRRKNAKPEFAVKKAVMRWLADNGFAVNAIEARAVFNPASGRYLNGQTDPGVSDILGVAPNGIAVAIELKAPGRRSTLKAHQREFLLKRIELGAFAVCVDSAECLELIWNDFIHRRQMEPQLGKAALLRHLPIERASEDSHLASSPFNVD